MSDIISHMTSSSHNKTTTKPKRRGQSREHMKAIGFKPGKRGVDAVIDPKINRKGTPVRSMAQLKKAIQNFLNEPTFDNKTMLDSVLIAMMKTKGDKILEFGFGKVPQPIEADISVQHSWKEFIAQQNAPELPAPADIEAEATLIDALADNDE